MLIVVAAFVGAENAASGGTLDQQIFDGSSTFAATWTEPLTRWNELYTQVWFQGCRRPDRRSGPRRVHLRPGRDDPRRTVGGIAHQEGQPGPRLRDGAGARHAGSRAVHSGAASPGLAINAKAKNPEAAKKFLAFYTDAKAVAMYNKATDAITTTTDQAGDRRR